jgi:hypothetical protein
VNHLPETIETIPNGKILKRFSLESLETFLYFCTRSEKRVNRCFK